MGAIDNHRASEREPIAGYYAKGFEQDRLSRGIGALEFTRTCDVLRRHLPPAPAAVADVGGGPGRYALWLAQAGYDVQLLDPVELHVEQARAGIAREGLGSRASAGLGDARKLSLADGSVDAVLLLGPLYHLVDAADRLRALSEARRVCRPNGVIVAAAISRFASTLDGLRGGYLADPIFADIAAADRATGTHLNPTNDPTYFTTAYFHRPEELARECA
ncbi:MAG TPA: class I SAM-dependent methyltransferase, partial [Gemmatimonadaceae bacterium]|nr:class I SAM-dependent methyltransferase [Gemmatimonadaceae bacterium]